MERSLIGVNALDCSLRERQRVEDYGKSTDSDVPASAHFEYAVTRVQQQLFTSDARE
jgi:hypothetical protein